MLTVDDYSQIRQARRDGLSIRQLAEQFRHSNRTIIKVLGQAEPKSYSLSKPRSAPVFGNFRPIVDEILAQDRTAPPKQRHTAQQIFRRLVTEHNYTGSYDPVRRYLQRHRLERRETFIPLEHPPGHRVEADFGHIYVDFPELRRHMPVLIVTWSYSNCPFALALPTERTEAILHGLVEAFAFFGCVPRELWWDNPKTVATYILQGRHRTLHPRYAALASHYNFTPRFCMPKTPTEKPRVEKRVQDLQRQWATPVPRVQDLVELNLHLHRQCLESRQRTCSDNALSVGERFEQDRAAALPLPPTRHRFDPCIIQPGQVDKYQTVRFDRNSYSVPRRWAFRPVSVKGYVDRVEVVGDGATIATHLRCYQRGQKILDPLHFLAVLARKPGALDHAPVYRDWQLPSVFHTLRHSLEEQHGSCLGTRHYIRVLQLLTNYPIEPVENAIASCLSSGSLDAAVVASIVHRQSCDNTKSFNGNALSLELSTVTVRPTDLSQFDRLLSHYPIEGDADEYRDHALVVEGQLEATTLADDVGRMGEVGA
jgi:transposase